MTFCGRSRFEGQDLADHEHRIWAPSAIVVLAVKLLH
jgi:hypothetical protein